MTACSVESCDRPAVARSWCATHWKRWKKHGDPLFGGELAPSGRGGCKVAGCETPADVSGYCPSHRGRVERHGDALKGRRPRGSKPTPCKLDECEKPSSARGLCEGHYRRLMSYGDPRAGDVSPLRGKSVEERFWHYTEKRRADQCWPWLAGKNRKGYGMLQVGSADNRAAHRVSYELAFGSIPEGMQIHHTCENKACQNPAHLVAMKPGAHTLIGNGFSGRNAQKTHCKNGHELSPENCYDYPGRRACKICAREKARKQEAKRKEERQAARERRERG
jgi:hypothetical protein